MKHLSGSRFAVGILLVMSITAAAIVVSATNGRNHTDRLRIENKTRSLIVESVKDLGAIRAVAQKEVSRFEVVVRNGYDKPIVAYSIRVEDSSTGKDTISAVERGGLVDDWALEPNGTDAAHVSTASEGEVVLTLFAVMFEDGTGDGDTDDLTRLQETRAGVKMAYEQIAPVLRRAISDNKFVMSDAAIQSLEDEVATITDRDVPQNLTRGFAQAKSYIGLELSDLKEKLRAKPNLEHRAEINKRLEKIEKALAKL